MSTKEVLLLKPIEGLGHEGEQVKVKAGYARNFLLPKKLAIPFTKANRKQMEALRQTRESRLVEELAVAKELAAKLTQCPIALPVKTGPGGKLFGSVTALDLQRRLAEEGIEIDRKKIPLHNPIKSLGKHSIPIKLHPEVVVDFAFEVVSENPIDNKP